jgi:DNA-directed RNA polymerase subunit RPC12/RpoP
MLETGILPLQDAEGNALNDLPARATEYGCSDCGVVTILPNQDLDKPFAYTHLTGELKVGMVVRRKDDDAWFTIQWLRDTPLSIKFEGSSRQFNPSSAYAESLRWAIAQQDTKQKEGETMETLVNDIMIELLHIVSKSPIATRLARHFKRESAQAWTRLSQLGYLYIEDGSWWITPAGQDYLDRRDGTGEYGIKAKPEQETIHDSFEMGNVRLTASAALPPRPDNLTEVIEALNWRTCWRCGEMAGVLKKLDHPQIIECAKCGAIWEVKARP